MEHSIVIRTANIGNYDRPRGIGVKDAVCEYYTDMSTTVEFVGKHGWTAILCERNGYDTVAIESDYYKWRPFSHSPDAEFVIWVDANIVPLVSANSLVNLLGDKDIAMFMCPHRKCIYDEAAAVLSDPRLRKSCKRLHMIKELMAEYRLAAYPVGNRLHETNVVIMRNTQKMVDVTSEIWELLLTRSDRDQLVVDYVLWKHVAPVAIIPRNARANSMFSYESHI